MAIAKEVNSNFHIKLLKLHNFRKVKMKKVLYNNAIKILYISRDMRQKHRSDT